MPSFFRRLTSFDNRFKTPLHFLTLGLIITVMIISGVRALVKDGPIRRSDTMALAMGSKSLIVIAYELLSEHVRRFKKWKSLKAYAILNGLEIVFWSAVCFLGFQGLLSSCTGTACILGWVSMVLAAFVTKFEAYMFMISFKDFRYFKKNGKPRGHIEEEPALLTAEHTHNIKMSEGVSRSDRDSEHRYEHRHGRSHHHHHGHGHGHGQSRGYSRPPSYSHQSHGSMA